MARRTGPYGGPERFFRTPVTAPGPDGPAMLRDFRLIRRDPLQFLVATWQRYGDVVQFPIPTPPTYLVTEPDAVDRVLRVNNRAYGKRTVQYTTLSLVTGEGLLTADTAAWRSSRRLVQPAFHPREVAKVADHTAVALDRLDRAWQALPDGAVVDVDAAMMHLALEVVGRALFGTDLSGDAERLAHATLRALDVVVARARNPLAPPRAVPTPGNLRLTASLRTLDGVVSSMLAERHARATGPGRDADMLDLLLTARDPETGDGGLTDTQVRDEIATFVVAGHETVASALTWAWWLLARDRSWQRRLAAEAREVLGDRAPAMADYGRLPVARAVMDETLRLYPPAWVITRRSLEPDVLGGHQIPAGALVIVSPWLVHRHPGLWPDPGEFRPDRWLGGRREERVRQGYLPFGLGPRMCIGRDFALVEGALVLSSLARRWRFEKVPGVDVHAEPVVTVRPRDGLPLVLRRAR